MIAESEEREGDLGLHRWGVCLYWVSGVWLVDDMVR